MSLNQIIDKGQNYSFDVVFQNVRLIDGLIIPDNSINPNKIVNGSNDELIHSNNGVVEWSNNITLRNIELTNSFQAPKNSIEPETILAGNMDDLILTTENDTTLWKQVKLEATYNIQWTGTLFTEPINSSLKMIRLYDIVYIRFDTIDVSNDLINTTGNIEIVFTEPIDTAFIGSPASIHIIPLRWFETSTTFINFNQQFNMDIDGSTFVLKTDKDIAQPDLSFSLRTLWPTISYISPFEI